MFKQYFKKFSVIFMVLFIVLMNANLVVAQQEVVQINKLDLQVMPEYDTQDILVLNTIQFKNTSTKDFSGELKWRIPKGSTKHIVTEKGNDKHLQSRIAPSKDYDEMIVTLQNPLKAGEIKEYHLEFYYNNLQGNPDKTFGFSFLSAYPVNQMAIAVLQPTKASNFRLPADFGQQSSQEGTYFVKRIPSLAKDTKVEFTATYTKTDPNPSFLPPNQQSGQAQTGTPTQGNTSNTSNIVIFSLAGFAVVIILIIAKAMANRNSDDEDDEEYEEYEDEYEDDEFEKQQYKIKRSMTKNKKPKNSNRERVNKPTERGTNKASEKNNNLSGLNKEQFDWLQEEKRKLKKRLESGRITEVDYYELLMELDEEAKQI